MSQEIIEFNINGLVLQEPMALITNWMMSFFSVYAFFKLKKSENTERNDWKKFFFWFAITSFFGGLGHLFFQQLGVPGKFPNWSISIIAAFYAGLAMLSAYEKRKWNKELKYFLFIKGIVLLSLAIISQLFIFIAIDAILTYVIYCGIIGKVLAVSKNKVYNQMFYGVLICLPSVFIFLFKLNIHRWLNKDDLSHLLMLACLFFFYRGAKMLSLQNK